MKCIEPRLAASIRCWGARWCQLVAFATPTQLTSHPSTWLHSLSNCIQTVWRGIINMVSHQDRFAVRSTHQIIVRISDNEVFDGFVSSLSMLPPTLKTPWVDKHLHHLSTDWCFTGIVRDSLTYSGISEGHCVVVCWAIPKCWLLMGEVGSYPVIETESIPSFVWRASQAYWKISCHA